MALNWETAKIKLRQYVSLLKPPNFDAANIQYLQYKSEQRCTSQNQDYISTKPS